MNVKQLLSLKNKVIVVTGGAGKYGKSIVEGLAEADAVVIAASRNLNACEQFASQCRQNKLDVHAMQLDQASHDSVLNLKNEIQKKFGRLDVFVNNAYLLPMLRYDDPLESWAKSMQVNATGMFDITREMADLMAQSGGGSIIHIGSMKGMYSPDFSLYEGTDMDSPPDYNFHKGGLISLTKYMARKLAHKKIRVNCISPGGLFANQPSAFLDKYVKNVPLGRMANGDDIKGLVVLLASEASAYLTGENILIDGGLHA
jgi:NAD(P)-dependent dehydrogenase (short-subunit alcohol dehydrogenase family)